VRHGIESSIWKNSRTIGPKNDLCQSPKAQFFAKAIVAEKEPQMARNLSDLRMDAPNLPGTKVTS
jgi:hypothetical protein